MSKKKIFGVGINDASYKVTIHAEIEGKVKQIGVCPFYQRWRNMLMRCYCESYLKKYPTYQGCTVCPEWLTFSNFRAWMETQEWDKQGGTALDKDLILEGNKIYSPETCVFLPKRINLFLKDNKSTRGDYPIGVSYNSVVNKYFAQCSQGRSNKSQSLGYFDTPEEAHKAWKIEKFRLAKILASEQSDSRVAKILINKYKM